jgi:hypothetical protein
VRRAGEYCMFYRDAMGFCLLENRCWADKPCPKSQAAADRAREQLVDEIIARRSVVNGEEAAPGTG